MQCNLSIFVVVFILICLSFNCTFPLHRDEHKSYFSIPFLKSKRQKCMPLNRSDNLTDRTKKMVSNIENAFHKFKNSTQDLGKNIQHYVSKNEENFKQYEKLVMLKKYPYLDLKEFYLRFSPFGRRHDESESVRYIGGDASLCEPPEDCINAINVEIINRGLSGFAIPVPIKNISEVKEDTKKITKKSSRKPFLSGLRDW